MTKAKRLVDARIQRAITGFLIPMMTIPKMYKAMEAGIAAGLTDEELKAIVAATPGVEPSVKR